MEHVIKDFQFGQNKELSVIESFPNSLISIKFLDYNNVYESMHIFELSKDQLHSFIGTLLHVQQKMKGGK